MPEQLPDLMAATKTLATAPNWTEHQDQFRFVVGLDMDGVTQEGLWLRGQCVREIPERLVTFQVEYMGRGLRRGPATRIDWRPDSPHTNKNVGPEHLRLLLIEGTHLHRFEHNWALGFLAAVGENLPVAEPWAPDPPTFQALTALVGDLFRIDGMEAVPEPRWEPRLRGI